MAFQETYVQEQDRHSEHREFRPLRDLIDHIRENKERRRQSRMQQDADALLQPGSNNDRSHRRDRISDAQQNPKSHTRFDYPEKRSRFGEQDIRIAERTKTNPSPNAFLVRTANPYSAYPAKNYIEDKQSKESPFRNVSERKSPGLPSQANPYYEQSNLTRQYDRQQHHSGYRRLQETPPGTRGSYPYPNASFESNEPPLANNPELETEKQENISGEKILADTITVKEKDGSLYDVAEMQGQSTDSRLEAYLNLRGKQLAELDLNGTGITDAGLKNLSKAPGLNKLMLNDTEASCESMAVLAKQGLKELKELNLHATRVGDDGVAHLKNMPIKILNLSDTIVSENCLGHLKAIKSLEVLTLDYSDIRDSGIKTLKDMPSLRSLSLKGCPITDDCLTELSKCKQIMLLNLEDTRISPEKVQWLQKNMPRCVVVGPDGKGVSQKETVAEKPFPVLRSLFERKR